LLVYAVLLDKLCCNTGNGCRGALKNPKFTQSLLDVIEEAGVAGNGCPKAHGNFLYTIASKVISRLSAFWDVANCGSLQQLPATAVPAGWLLPWPLQLDCMKLR